MDHNKISDAATVAELESGLESAIEAVRDLQQRGRLPAELRPLLQLVPPEGASVHVSLRQRDSDRQLRRAQSANSFAPRHCGVWIVYELPTQRPHEERGRAESGVPPLSDFVLALDHAEKDPHLQFISLKWFRDTYLVKRGYAWASDPDIPRQLTQDMTDRGLILTSKVPNPKSPEFPVTSIRLNRAHPDVKKILGTHGGEPSTLESAESHN